ncbi:MAG: glucose PTS transporter subunit EIIB, partial [Bacillus sp. (in: firmicutes)]
MDHKKIAREVLNAIGGQENVSAAAHCATRLRLVLNDESAVDQSALENMDVVKGTFSTGGQFQIILGSGTVNEVYKHLAEMSGQTEMSTSDVKNVATKKLNPIQQF